jgi:rhomboid protease GluP
MRKRTGSVVCPSCGVLVGVNDDECLNCGRKNPGMWGFGPAIRKLTDIPFTQIVIITCALLYVAMFLYSGGRVEMRGMFGFMAPPVDTLYVFGASGAVPIYHGRWWTPLSATWLHAGLLHIFFNMMWVNNLSPAVAHLYGPSRAIIIFVVAGVSGFVASSLIAFVFPFGTLPWFLAGARLTVGASASIFGLLGALMYYQRRGPTLLIGSQAKMFAIIMLVFGLVMPGIDNWAHLGGLGGGFLVSMWLDPLKPERLDHTVAALLCLVASAAAIIASIAIA